VILIIVVKIIELKQKHSL